LWQKLRRQKADEAKAVQVVATAKVAAAKKVADDAQALQQKEVNKLRAVQDKLMQELANARNVRVTLEQQRQLALLEESQADNCCQQLINQAKVWPDLGLKGQINNSHYRGAAFGSSCLCKETSTCTQAIYLGNFEDLTPFDCSGLVYAAYKAAGLDWPNWDRLNSALYSGYTEACCTQ
jgi:cell wall-associated NlpC family hydrolase